MMTNKTMKYPVATVRDRLEENRTKHIDAYDEAMKGFRTKRAELYAQLARLMNAALDPTDRKAINARYDEVYKLRQTVSCLPRPESHVDDYDRAIDMLHCCADEYVEMDGDTFDKYMRDEWKWKQAFAVATKQYVDSAISR